MLNISADMTYLQDTCANVRVYRVPQNLPVDMTITTSSWRFSKSNFMSGTLAEYKTSFHRSYPCVVFLSTKKLMRVVDGKRTTKVEKLLSFPVLLGTSFINCSHLDLRVNQHQTPGRDKNLCKPMWNRYEYYKYVKKLFDIIQDNCHLIYVN